MTPRDPDPTISTLEALLRYTDVGFTILSAASGIAGAVNLGRRAAGGAVTERVARHFVGPPAPLVRLEGVPKIQTEVVGGRVADAFTIPSLVGQGDPRLGAFFGLWAGGLSASSAFALAGTGAAVAPVALTAAGAWTGTRSIDRLTGFGSGVFREGLFSGLLVEAWFSKLPLVRRRRHQAALKAIDVATYTEAAAQKRKVFAQHRQVVFEPMGLGNQTAPVGRQPRARAPLPAPSLPLRRQHRMRSTASAPRPFTWLSDEIPPPHLQSQFRADRPAQPGWGLEVQRSEPWQRRSASERLRTLGTPDSTVATLRSWERHQRERQAVRAWVDAAHTQHIRSSFRHDPIRQAAELLSVSQRTFVSTSPNTALAIGRYAQQIESQQRVRSMLSGPFTAAPMFPATQLHRTAGVR